MHEPDVVILKLNKEKLLLMTGAEFGMDYENETNVAIHPHSCLH